MLKIFLLDDSRHGMNEVEWSNEKAKMRTSQNRCASLLLGVFAIAPAVTPVIGMANDFAFDHVVDVLGDISTPE